VCGQVEDVEDDAGAALGPKLGGDRRVDAATLRRADVVVERGAHDRVGELVAAIGRVGQQPRLDQAVERPGHLVLRHARKALGQPEVAEGEPPEDGGDTLPLSRRSVRPDV
jgi:hypothetical protein